MQVLSDRLVAALERDGGKLLMRHTVERIVVEQGRPTGVVVRNQKTGQTLDRARRPCGGQRDGAEFSAIAGG
jgi:phytoene dehydrogenase-like protein